MRAGGKESDSAIFLDCIDNPAYQVYRNGEANAFGAYILREDHGIYAYQLAVGIDQGTARITRIDRGISLDEILESNQSQRSTPGSTYYPLCDCFGQSVRIANCEHNVAHA